LLTAKVETPVLVYSFPEEKTFYQFTAVDDTGIGVACVWLSSDVDASDDSFEYLRAISGDNNSPYAGHFIPCGFNTPPLGAVRLW
jgi:hypothetical protein